MLTLVALLHGMQEHALVLNLEGTAHTSPHDSPGEEPVWQTGQNGLRLAAQPPYLAAFPKVRKVSATSNRLYTQ